MALNQAPARPSQSFQISYKYNTNTRPKRVGPLSHGHHFNTASLLHFSPFFLTSSSSSLYLFFFFSLTHISLHSCLPNRLILRPCILLFFLTRATSSIVSICPSSSLVLPLNFLYLELLTFLLHPIPCCIDAFYIYRISKALARSAPFRRPAI